MLEKEKLGPVEKPELALMSLASSLAVIENAFGFDPQRTLIRRNQ